MPQRSGRATVTGLSFPPPDPSTTRWLAWARPGRRHPRPRRPFAEAPALRPKRRCPPPHPGLLPSGYGRSSAKRTPPTPRPRPATCRARSRHPAAPSARVPAGPGSLPPPLPWRAAPASAAMLWGWRRRGRRRRRRRRQQQQQPLRSRRWRAAQQVQAAGRPAAPPLSQERGHLPTGPDPTAPSRGGRPGEVWGAGCVCVGGGKTSSGGAELSARPPRGAPLRARGGGAQPAWALPGGEAPAPAAL